MDSSRIVLSRAQTALSRRSYNRAVTRALSLAVIHFRRVAGLSQGELASASGVSRSAINAIESGQSGDVFVRTVWLLAVALGITPCELLMWGADRIEPGKGNVVGSRGPAGELVLNYGPELSRG